MRKFNYYLFALLVSAFFVLTCPLNVSAASVPVSGKAEAVATSNYVNFTSYTVTIDNTTGVFAGRAFSDDIGYIEFGTTDNPDGPVAVNLDTGAVTGKAFVINTENLIDFSNGTVVLNTNTGAFSGSIWSTDIGWIDFADTGVSTNLGSKLLNLSASLAATTAADWATSVTATRQLGTEEPVGITKVADSRRIALMNIDFSSNINWSGVTADSVYNKAFFHSPVSISDLTNGESSSYTLYIFKGDSEQVYICPGVDSLSEITLGCASGYYLNESSPNVTVASEGGVTYWKVSGLTGTGGMSIIEGLSDTMSRLAANTVSNHTIIFGTEYGLLATDTGFTIEFDAADHAFDLGSLDITDVELTDLSEAARTIASSAGVSTWGLSINTTNDTLTFTVPTSGGGYYPAASQVIVKIGLNAQGGINQIINPPVGTYDILITLNNAEPGEQGTITVPIVDSDQVDVTGFVNTFINFDIDTSVTDTDCTFDVCLTHENGEAGSNYTVDLGELSSTWVNASNSNAVMHSQGGEGIINSIYFDLTTNAYEGAIVYVTSENGGLQGPGTNMLSYSGDPEVGFAIDANSGRYGYNVPSTFPTGNGSIGLNGACSGPGLYCLFTTTARQLFSTGGKPLEAGRVRMDIAAAASYTNNPGLYTDTLTFTVVATY